MKLKITKAGLRLMALLISMPLVLSACRDDFERTLPLAVDQRTLALPSDAGAEHLMVYSTSAWTTSFSEERSWIAIRKATGSANGEIVLDYDENRGIARLAKIVIRAKGLEEQIVVTQTGRIATPSMTFLESEKILSAAGGEYALGFATNMGEALDRIRPLVACLDADGAEIADAEPWIDRIVVAEDAVSFVADPNTTGESRRLRLTLAIDDEVNGVGYSVAIDIEQQTVVE